MRRNVERARIGRELGPEATIVSMPVPSAPARRMAASISAATSRSGDAGGDRVHARLRGRSRRSVRMADHVQLGRRLPRAQFAQVVLDVDPLRRRQGVPEGRHQVRADQAAAAQAHAPRRRQGAPDVGHDLGQALDPGEGIVLVGMGELAQHAHVGDAAGQEGVLVALGPHEHDGLPTAGHQDAGGFEVDREVRQPAGVRRPEGGPVVGVGNQHVEVACCHHGLHPAPALWVLGRGDPRLRLLVRHLADLAYPRGTFGPTRTGTV